jgi:hypothetical protein
MHPFAGHTNKYIISVPGQLLVSDDKQADMR